MCIIILQNNTKSSNVPIRLRSRSLPTQLNRLLATASAHSILEVIDALFCDNHFSLFFFMVLHVYVPNRYIVCINARFVTTLFHPNRHHSDVISETLCLHLSWYLLHLLFTISLEYELFVYFISLISELDQCPEHHSHSIKNS